VFVSDSIQKQAAVRTIVARSGDEDLQKAVEDRGAAMKQAMAAAKKKYPGGVPKDVRSKIFKDPAGWLKANSGGDETPAEPEAPEK
jgi:hypothetical protein